MSSKLPIVGTIYTNDRAGFLKLIADANEHSDSHVIVNAFPLGGDKIAAIFRRREREEAKGSFFDPLDG
jgi:hypothetical protein